MTLLARLHQCGKVDVDWVVEASEQQPKYINVRSESQPSSKEELKIKEAAHNFWKL